MEAIKWTDEYYNSEHRVVLTNRQIPIPGLRTFAMHNMRQAFPPLGNHYHENAFEIVYVRNGTISFYVDGREYRVSGGDIFLTFPGEIHSTNGIPMSRGTICWMQLDISSQEQFLFLNKEAAGILIRSLYAIPGHSIHTDNREIASAILTAFSCALKPDSWLLTATYLQLFLQLMIGFCSTGHASMTPDIGRAMDYIFDHLTENLSLEQLAAQCHLSTSRFKAKFREQIGSSPRDFINRQKIEYAKTLLDEQRTITEIAMTLNYASSSYFAYIFKKYTSFSPSEYQARRRNSGSVSL